MTILSLFIGVGFSGIENFVYYFVKISPFDYGILYWTSVVIYRTFFNMVAHGLFTSIFGLIIWHAKSHILNMPVAITTGYLFSMILHSIFNFSAIIDAETINQTRNAFILFNPVSVIIMAVGIYVIALIMNGDKLDFRSSFRKKTKT